MCGSIKARQRPYRLWENRVIRDLCRAAGSSDTVADQHQNPVLRRRGSLDISSARVILLVKLLKQKRIFGNPCNPHLRLVHAYKKTKQGYESLWKPIVRQEAIIYTVF